MRKAKRRTIYDNYNLWEDYEQDARESLEANGIEEPSDDDIWDEIYDLDEINWQDEKASMERFFDRGPGWILQGMIGRWDGKHRGGFMFSSFQEMFGKAGKDCDYFHFYDENGHFYLKCSHHDGTNLYEIKKVTEQGVEYFENWENYRFPNDTRSMEFIHDQIMKRYSVLPHFAHLVYGCPKVEYEPAQATA